MRKDVIRKREQILSAAGRLLAGQGATFSLPDLAREAEVGTATVYRHFADVDEVLQELVQQLLGELTGRLETLEEDHSGRELFERVCAVWVESALSWAAWAARFRSGDGFLVRSQDEQTNEYLHRRFLERVLRSLAEDEPLVISEPDYVIVLWVALFDERVLHDLRAQGLAPQEIVERLTTSMCSLLTLGTK